MENILHQHQLRLVVFFPIICRVSYIPLLRIVCGWANYLKHVCENGNLPREACLRRSDVWRLVGFLSGFRGPPGHHHVHNKKTLRIENHRPEEETHCFIQHLATVCSLTLLKTNSSPMKKWCLEDYLPFEMVLFLGDILVFRRVTLLLNTCKYSCETRRMDLDGSCPNLRAAFEDWQQSISVGSYCWWLKSCTTWDVWKPVDNGIFTIWSGVGYLPQ